MTRKLEDWLLSSPERGNPATILDERHAGKAAWSVGNQVRPLVHGAVYFAELLAGVNELWAVTGPVGEGVVAAVDGDPADDLTLEAH
jgi:hypothetical protein